MVDRCTVKNMFCEKNSAIVEAKALQVLSSGSYEDQLQRISEAVSASDGPFGTNTYLFATYPDKVIVYTEGDGFFTCGYSVDNGEVLFDADAIRRENVPVVTEDTLATSGINAFYNGDGVAGALADIVAFPSKTEEPTAESAEREMNLLFKSRIWTKYVLEGGSADRIRDYATDSNLFNVPVTVESVGGEHILNTIMNRLGKMHAETDAVLRRYEQKMSRTRTLDEDEILAEFESVSSDFIIHIESIMEAVSVALAKMNNGYSDYAMEVADRVAKTYGDLHLGHRFVRKMAGQLMTV